jgi:heme/copper-type cytochrome/quinol oxidase subunit 2
MRGKRLIIGLSAIAVLGWLLLPLPTDGQPETHHISIDMTQYEFNPARVQVSQGDRLVIDLTASDVVHGYYLDGYGIEQRVEPGITRQVTITADQPGKYRFRCSVACGELHPFMIGELVVTPNLPFWRAVGLMVTILFLYLWYLKRSNGYEQKQVS